MIKDKIVKSSNNDNVDYQSQGQGMLLGRQKKMAKEKD